nr:hypothetical protein [Tanacetum cinerariifolium]
MNSKAFRVFNSRKRIVKENLHIRFSENTPNVVGTQSNGFLGTKPCDNAGQARKETETVKDYILLPLWTVDLLFSQDPKSSQDNGLKPSSDDERRLMKIQVMEVNAEIKSRQIQLTTLTITFNFLSDHEDDDEEAD